MSGGAAAEPEKIFRILSQKSHDFVIWEGVLSVLTVGERSGGSLWQKSGGARAPSAPPIPTCVREKEREGREIQREKER